MANIYARQNLNDGNDGDEFVVDGGEVPFWWTRVGDMQVLGLSKLLTSLQTGQIIRWSIFWGVLILFVAYMAIGYWHARRRLNRGLRPLAYHRVSPSHSLAEYIFGLPANDV
jgi:hypothetical protein